MCLGQRSARYGIQTFGLRTAVRFSVSCGTTLGFRSLILGFCGTNCRTSNCLGLLSSRTVLDQLASDTLLASLEKAKSNSKSNNDKLRGLRPPIHPSREVSLATLRGESFSPLPNSLRSFPHTWQASRTQRSRSAPFVRFRSRRELMQFKPRSRCPAFFGKDPTGLWLQPIWKRLASPVRYPRYLFPLYRRCYNRLGRVLS